MNALHILAHQVGLHLATKKQKLVTAESCTGGMIAEVLTTIPGSSKWFERGFITYSLDSKIELLGVPKQLITRFSAVSEPVVKYMALGALKNSHADWAIATTGIAGPTGGTETTPVGTVFIAWASTNTIEAQSFHYSGNRNHIRKEATKTALLQLIAFLK